MASPKGSAQRPTAIVVGGGWSGISAAWYLRKTGYRVSLVDRGGSLGGRSASAALGNRSVTLGGKNIGRRNTLFRAFVAELGTAQFEHFGINSSRVEGKWIRTVDSGAAIRGFLGLARRTPPIDLVRLLGMAGMVRFGDKNRFLGGPGFTRLARRGDRPLDQVLGPRLTERLVRPMTVRMNAAEPDEAFLGNFGTNLGMLLDSYEQLTSGFAPTFDAFSAVVETSLNTQVDRLLVEDGTVVGVTVRSEDGRHAERRADVVVVALPSWDAADLVAETDDTLVATLREIRYFPVGVAIAEYGQPVFSEGVRALVLPAGSPVSNAGAYGMNDRAVVRYTFSGRAARPYLAQGLDAAALADIGESELSPHIAVPTTSRRHVVSATWQRGLCAYGPDHAARLARISEAVNRLPGLALTGDYHRGASIEACFQASHDVVHALAGTLDPEMHNEPLGTAAAKRSQPC